MMRTNTKKFKVLEFIGRHKGVRYMDIERFLCELDDKDYDLKVETRVWDYRTKTSKFMKVRRHKGIWGTNLCYGKDAILHKYCVKTVEKRWMLNAETAGFIRRHNAKIGVSETVYHFSNGFHFDSAQPSFLPKSSLEAALPSDTIKGNSVAVSVDRYDLQGGLPEKPRFTREIKEPFEIKATVEASPITRAIDHLEVLREQLKTAGDALSAAQALYNKLLMEVGRAKTDVRNLLDL